MIRSLISNQSYARIARLKNNLFVKSNKSYSQFGEDIILQKLLKKKNGFYVDVGAYHPKHYSNTYLLYKKGWSGINIDPNSDAIRLFNKERKRDINLAIGISQAPAMRVYYTFSHSNWNTFSKEQAEQWMRKEGVNFLGEQQVACLPLKDVLAQHLPTKINIDLLNVDVEGMDLEVLKTNNWEKYRPEVIVAESREFNPSSPSQSALYAFLVGKSYVLYAFMGLSLIFKKNESPRH